MNRKEYTQKDFAWTHMSIEDIQAFPDRAILNIKSKIEKIKDLNRYNKKNTENKALNFNNTILAYEKCSEEEAVDLRKISTLGMVGSNKDVRDAARNAEVKFSNLLTDIVYDIDLYKVIKNYYEHNFILEKELKTLDAQDIKLVEDVMIGLNRMGFALEKSDRNKLKTLDKKESKLSNEYDMRLAENNDFMLCSEEEMFGIPENVKESFTKVKDKYKVSLQYPEYGPYIKYAENREKRKEIYKLFMNQGGERNVKLIEELISLRAEKAKILGYEHHARYKTETRMAKHEKHAYKMLRDILKSLKVKKDEDLEEIKEEAKTLGINKLEMHDTSFITNKIRETRYAYDEQEVREYFPLDHVLSTMFEIFGELFSFKVEEANIKLWHKDAKLYKFTDNKTNSLISYLAMDLFPREGKFGHACMMPTIDGMTLDDKNYQTPFATLVCNFSKPQQGKKQAKKQNIPSLLTIAEVETLYHEFGHGLHGIMTKAKHTSHSGTNVVWDFVEGPSQIMEQWALEEKVLSKISKNYITGKPLPKSIIKKIQNLKNFMSGLFYTGQAVQSILDLDLYTGVARNPVEHYHKLIKKNIMPQNPDILFVSRFAHIARGYDAGYYSYLWAENIAKDMYSIFKDKNIFDKKIGERYRKEILEVGGSRTETESVEAFLGRAIDSKAFAKSLF